MIAPLARRAEPATVARRLLRFRQMSVSNVHYTSYGCGAVKSSADGGALNRHRAQRHKIRLGLNSDLIAYEKSEPTVFGQHLGDNGKVLREDSQIASFDFRSESNIRDQQRAISDEPRSGAIASDRTVDGRAEHATGGSR